MKSVSTGYKQNIKSFGKEIAVKITYTINGTTTILENEDINSVNFNYEGNLLKSVMKQLEIDSNTNIPLKTVLTYQFGVKVGNSYEYITLGDFIVTDSEKQENTNSYILTCYDYMLYAMTDYEDLNIVYPISVRDYLSAICTKLGVTFGSSSSNFINYNQSITEEPYLDENGNSIGYTFRDVLDELAQITASTICINNSGQLEVRYIKEYNKNILNNKFNVSSGQFTIKYNEVDNSLTFNGTTSSAMSINLQFPYKAITLQGGNQYTLGYIKKGGSVQTSGSNYFQYQITNIPTSQFNLVNYNNYATFNIANNTNINQSSFLKLILGQGTTFDNFTIGIRLNKGTQLLDEITLTEDDLKDINVNFGERYVLDVNIDNQILNYMDKQTVLTNAYNKLNGIEYYLNNFDSFGITYLELCDAYNVKIGNTTYNCLMLNDEINVNDGLKETIYTEKPEDTEEEFTYVNDTDKAVRRATITLDQKIGEVDIRGKTINMTADNISISSDHFNVTDEGVVTATEGNFGGWNLSTEGFRNNDGFFIKNSGVSNVYTMSDIIVLRLAIAGTINIQSDSPEFDHFDINKDGVLNIQDLVLLRQMLIEQEEE